MIKTINFQKKAVDKNKMINFRRMLKKALQNRIKIELFNQIPFIFKIIFKS